MNTEKGVTLLELVITIVVMMVLVVTATTNITSTLKLREYYAVKEDIIVLADEVKNYYNENEVLPVSKTYEFNLNSLNAKDKNPNDNDVYYIIDLNKLKYYDGGISLNNEGNLYIVNEQSFTVYYPKGIEINGEIHYTIEE